MSETKTYETLYGIDKNGKTKKWNITVEDKGDHSCVVYTYGQLQGKQTECTLVIDKGKNIGKKNETTHFEQAHREAQSKWNNKKDTDGYTTNLENIKKSDVKLPMLAQEYKKHSHKVKFPSFIQPKLDGYRLLYNPQTKTVISRTGKEYTVLYDTDLYKELSLVNLHLDGELYVHDRKFNFENYGTLRKQKNLNSTDQNVIDSIEYHVYDVINETLTYEERLKQLQDLFEKNTFTKIKFVDTYVCGSKEQIDKFHTQFITDNYEGSMIRNKDGMYRCKYRSYDLLKNKDFDDGEFEIVNFTSEKDTTGGNMPLVVWTCKTPEGNLFNVRPKGTETERKELYTKANSYKGQKLWVQYFGLTEAGIPRFPSTKTASVDSYIRSTVF